MPEQWEAVDIVILKYFPVKKDGTIDFVPSNPLMSIVKERDEYTIYYGNRRLSKIKPDFVDHTYDDKNIKVNISGTFIITVL